jgi:hypothetical protein
MAGRQPGPRPKGRLRKLRKICKNRADRSEIVRLVQGRKRYIALKLCSTSASIRTGLLYSGPPCTTRWPTALGGVRCSSRSHAPAVCSAVGRSDRVAASYSRSTRLVLSAPRALSRGRADPIDLAFDLARKFHGPIHRKQLELDAGGARIDDKNAVDLTRPAMAKPCAGRRRKAPRPHRTPCASARNPRAT